MLEASYLLLGAALACGCASEESNRTERSPKAATEQEPAADDAEGESPGTQSEEGGGGASNAEEGSGDDSDTSETEPSDEGEDEGDDSDPGLREGPLDPDLYVSTDGADDNPGSEDQPFATIGKALAEVSPGETVLIRDGTYRESLSTQVAATPDNPITVISENPRAAIVTSSGRVLNVRHPNYVIQGLVFDGQYGESDIVRVRDNADNLAFRNNEVRRGSRDAIDMGSPQGVLIEASTIHDVYFFDDGERIDAHGIVTAGVRDLVVKDTEVFYVTGDSLQLQYGAWDNVLVDGCHFWNGALPDARGDAPAGQNPGENAIDTKQEADAPRGTLTVRDSVFHGWKSDYVSTGAAMVLKHNVEVIVDGNTFYDNRYAMRLRGPNDRGGAHVTAMNNVYFDHEDYAIRYEDGIENLRIFNNTFGAGNNRIFQSAGGSGSGFQVLNNLFLGDAKPAEASDGSNLAVPASSFVDAPKDDYHLTGDSPAIDSGQSLDAVSEDRDGVSRPQADAYDVGAYERESE